jgi:four helix bundle protein
MDNKISSYKDLIVWQKSITLVTDVYVLTKSFASEEKYGIVSQMNRAAVSVPCNIAEGSGRESSKSYLQFLKVSKGSLMEVETLMVIAKKLNFITEKEYKIISDNVEELAKILQGLIKSIKQKILITEN